jgi:hypothetical protein
MFGSNAVKKILRFERGVAFVVIVVVVKVGDVEGASGIRGKKDPGTDEREGDGVVTEVEEEEEE